MRGKVPVELGVVGLATEAVVFLGNRHLLVLTSWAAPPCCGHTGIFGRFLGPGRDAVQMKGSPADLTVPRLVRRPDHIPADHAVVRRVGQPYRQCFQQITVLLDSVNKLRGSSSFGGADSLGAICLRGLIGPTSRRGESAATEVALASLSSIPAAGVVVVIVVGSSSRRRAFLSIGSLGSVVLASFSPPGLCSAFLFFTASVTSVTSIASIASTLSVCARACVCAVRSRTWSWD